MIQKYTVPKRCGKCTCDVVYELKGVGYCEDHYLAQIDIEFSKAMREAEMRRTGQLFLFDA